LVFQNNSETHGGVKWNSQCKHGKVLYMKEDWKKHWGNEYEITGNKYLSELLDRCDKDRKIGDFVVDVGSRENAISRVVEKKGRKIMRVDIGAKELEQTEDTLLIPYDIEKAGDDSFTTKRG